MSLKLESNLSSASIERESGNAVVSKSVRKWKLSRKLVWIRGGAYASPVKHMDPSVSKLNLKHSLVSDSFASLVPIGSSTL